MSTLLRYLLLVAVVAAILADTASAQLLPRRRWENRRAQMEAQLSRQLNAKLDADLSREVAAATEKLQQTAVEQVNAEAARLEAHMREQLAALRKEAEGFVKAEGERLAQEAAQKVTEMQATTQAKIDEQREALRKQVSQEAAQLAERFAAHKQVLDQQAEKVQSLANTVDSRLNQLPALLQAAVDEHFAKLKSDAPPAAPAPKPEESSSDSKQNQQALETRRTEVVADKKPSEE